MLHEVEISGYVTATCYQTKCKFLIKNQIEIIKPLTFIINLSFK